MPPAREGSDMTQQDDFDRGATNRRAVLGDAWVDEAQGAATAFNADFQDLITRYAWHGVWGRPGLDHTTRRLLVLSMTMGLARWEEFELHCKAAIRGGVPVEKIRETLMQGAIYCGVPAANTAFKIAARILGDEGMVSPPRSLAAGERVATHHTFSEPQLKVAVQGQGRPAVLSHALGLDLSMWDGFAAALAASHEVARYDHRGHGGSAVPSGPYTLDQLVDDAARLIREWGRGPVVWVGLSLGGMVGQGLAVRYPELLRALVLASTVARYPEEAQAGWQQRLATVESAGMAGVADAALERFLHADFRAAHPHETQAVRERLLRCDAAGYLATCHAARAVNWLDRLAGVRVPTLVIAGARDVGAPPAMAQEIAQRIPGAALSVLDNASHLSVIEQPQAFTAAVLDFLQRVE